MLTIIRESGDVSAAIEKNQCRNRRNDRAGQFNRRWVTAAT